MNKMQVSPENASKLTVSAVEMRDVEYINSEISRLERAALIQDNAAHLSVDINQKQGHLNNASWLRGRINFLKRKISEGMVSNDGDK